jgi:signal transduction histidine kinase
MSTDLRRLVDVVLVATGIVSLWVLAWPLGTVHPVGLAFVLALASCLPWLWRDQFPIGTLAVSGAGLVAAIIALHAYNWASAVAIVLLFLVAFDGDRRRSLMVGAATAFVLAGVVVALIPALERSEGVSAAVPRVLAALGALVIGDLARSRRELRAAARDRTEREVRELRDRADRQAAVERLRIARELHDTLAHALVAINVRSGVTAHLGVSPEASAALTEIKDVSAQALADLRATLDVLRDPDAPASRDPAMGLASVPMLVDRANGSGLRADAELALDGVAIPSVIDHAGFRIVQEALTNVVRHARASHALVRVAARAGALTIEVLDDGRGAAVDGQGIGHGIQGMAERAAAVGGTVSAGPRDGRGWHVHATLPITGGRA